MVGLGLMRGIPHLRDQYTVFGRLSQWGEEYLSKDLILSSSPRLVLLNRIWYIAGRLFLSHLLNRNAERC